MYVVIKKIFASVFFGLSFCYSPVIYASSHDQSDYQEVASRDWHTACEIGSYDGDQQLMSDVSEQSIVESRSLVNDGMDCGMQTHHSLMGNFGLSPIYYQVPPVTITRDEILGASCAAHALQENVQLASTKQYVDAELSSILDVVQNGSPNDREMLLGTLDGLRTAFDDARHDVLQGLRAPDMLKKDLNAIKYLNHELQNVIDSIKVELHTKNGVFLDGTRDSFVNGFRVPGQNNNIEDLVKTYHQQYKNNRAQIIPPADQKRLQKIEFNTALLKYNECLKQGDLLGANAVIKQFDSLNKDQAKRLQSSKNSLLNEFGVPKVWESNPQWKAYQQEFGMRSDQTDRIIRELQKEHNMAVGLCGLSGISEPSVVQLNHAHQLRAYHEDPNFLSIARQALQEPEAFQLALNTLEQRANTLEQMRLAVLKNPDVAALLREEMHELLIYDHDPQFMPAVEQMAQNPEAVAPLKHHLWERDVFVQDMREWLGHELFSNQAEQVTYQLHDAQTDAQRIDALSSLSADHELQGVRDAYHTFYDEVAHLPRIFNYDDRLLETTLPEVIATTAFAPERTLYTYVMIRPIECDEQLRQAQQCISFLRDACVSQEQQDAYRDLASTACRTYVNQSQHYTREDYLQQVELFDKAHQSLQQCQQADMPSSEQHAVVQRQIEANLTSVDYVQLHDQVAKTSDAIEQQTGKVSEYYQSREQALQQMAQGDLLVHHKEYSLSPQAADVLKQAGHDPAQFASCKGNLVQQDNHAKLVSSLNKLAHKPVRTQAAQQLKEGVLECAQAGNALNQSGNIQEAMMMSDICHVAVDHIWQFVDSGVSLSAGFGEGLIQGVGAFYNTEVSSMRGDGEFALSAYTQPSDGLRDVARAETSQAVYEVLALLKDIGEVSLEAGYGAADSIKNMPHLVSDMVDVTRALGTTLATLGADSLVLLDAAEHGNLQDFTQQLDKMNADCRQIKEGLDAFTTQLGEHIKAHMPQDGQITKAHAKMAVRTGARMVTDAVVMNLGMKGVSAICKGVSGHVGQMSKELGRIKEIKDVSVAEVRKALLVAQLERSPLAAQAPTLYKGTMWAHVVKDQVKMLQPMVNRASSMKTIEDMVQSSIKRSVETQPSRFESTIQKAQRWLSMQPKPGYILLPGAKTSKQPFAQPTSHPEIRQAIINREREIVPDDLKKLGFIGEFKKLNKYDKVTGRIFLNTELSGGITEAKQILHQVKNEFEASKKLIDKVTEFAENGSERIFYKFEDGSSVQMRTSGKSGHPKVEVTDIAKNIKEKITFT